MELSQEVIEAATLITNSGFDLQNLPDFVNKSFNYFYCPLNKETLENLGYVYLPYHDLFDTICKAQYIGSWNTCITSKIQVLDLYKAKDLWYIFQLLKNSPSEFIQVCISLNITRPNLGNFNPENLRIFCQDLDFGKLIKLYGASFNDKLLFSIENETQFVAKNLDLARLDGKDMYIDENNIYQFTENSTNKITSHMDQAFTKEAKVNDKGLLLDTISHNIGSKPEKGFKVVSKLNGIITAKGTMPYECQSYISCLDYMQHKHEDRLNVVKAYNLINEQAPDLLRKK